MKCPFYLFISISIDFKAVGLIFQDRMMSELHSQGKTVDDITECLNRTPLHPNVISAIKSARALGCDLKILSDANQFFIEKILDHHGLLGCFSQIITNPSFVDGEGKLRIFPFHDLSSPPHGCHLCPANLCKGLVIEQIRAENRGKRFIYLGDGSGDFCPSLKLGEGDYVMPRKDYSLWNCIGRNPDLVKAEVHEWSNGDELGKVLLCLINKISSEEIIKKSSECKVSSTQEAHPQTLTVPH